MLTSDITKYVRLAFDVAGDLVKKLTVTPTSTGTFVPATGKMSKPATISDRFIVEAVDHEEKESIGAGFTDKSMRRYIMVSPNIIKVGFTFIDDAITYTVSRASPIQQSSTVFVYQVWAEA